MFPFSDTVYVSDCLNCLFNCLQSLLYLLYYLFILFFFPSLSSNPHFPLSVIICPFRPCSTSSVGRLLQHSHPLLSHFTIAPCSCHLFYSLFVLTSLTNIPIDFSFFCPFGLSPFILSSSALSLANHRSFPPSPLLPSPGRSPILWMWRKVLR